LAEASSNHFQFAGRENDGTGLYYYRARYYSPELQRFISEDPIGLAGGLNFYAYVGNSPLNFVDELGLDRSDAERTMPLRPLSPRGRAGSAGDLLQQVEDLFQWFTSIRELNKQECAILKMQCEMEYGTTKEIYLVWRIRPLKFEGIQDTRGILVNNPNDWLVTQITIEGLKNDPHSLPGWPSRCSMVKRGYLY
jgi:RHS repeat-associated protein